MAGIRRLKVFAAATMLLSAGSNGICEARTADASGQQQTEALFLEWQALIVRIEGGGDPQVEAAAAIARNDFGLLTFQYGMGGWDRPIGVDCFTPLAKAPRMRASIGGGDAIDDRVAKVLRYGEVYNRVIVEHADYPDADLCRVSSQDDLINRLDVLVSQPARAITRAPLSLHEAARRGSKDDLKRFDRGQIDSVDGLGMTPLAWAAARGNRVAFDYLIGAGANPWIDENRKGAVYWSAATGRVEYFKKLIRRPGKPFERWPEWHLRAAAGNGGPILEAMLSQPHEKLHISSLYTLPAADIVNRLLRDDPTQADPLLVQAAGYGPRPDLVALALRRGANPNAEAGSSRTVLGEIASGIDPASVEIVDLLLKAGADPNAPSWLDHPVWIALRTTRTFPADTALKARALSIYHRLHRAGANLNLPNGEGVPQVWTLLFPMRYDHDEIEANAGTPQILEMLVHDGLDLNVSWRGRTLLSLVEQKAGVNSELATTMRRLGAK